LVAALGDGLAACASKVREHLGRPSESDKEAHRAETQGRLSEGRFSCKRALQAPTKMTSMSLSIPQAGLGRAAVEADRMRVLLVEDEVSLALGLQVALKSGHYTVDVVHDGSSALHALSQEDFDIAVLDLGLPRMDGLQVLRELRRRHNSIPVLVLTARDATADRIAGLDAGADDYLVKPFEVGELQARLRALLRRRVERASPMLKVGDVTLDPATRMVTCRGLPVSLGRREFMLLHQLMAQPGRVLTRDRLEQGLYGWNEEAAESNALEVHIHHLRRKLRPDFIHTVRGVGYRVESA
jgi:two-component system response regulator QseB